jgi:HD-GYP domain-containing protein (c-di-GMP phosphodiesterase class II)
LLPAHCTILKDRHSGYLLKPGRLTAEAFEVMKKHVEIGGEILQKVCKLLKWSR